MFFNIARILANVLEPDLIADMNIMWDGVDFKIVIKCCNIDVKCGLNENTVVGDFNWMNFNILYSNYDNDDG